MYKEEHFLDSYTNWRAFDVRDELIRTIYNRIKERFNGEYYKGKVKLNSKNEEKQTWNDIKRDEMEKFYSLMGTIYEDIDTEEQFLRILKKNSNILSSPQIYKEKGFLETYTNWRAFEVKYELMRTIYNRIKERFNGEYYEGRVKSNNKCEEKQTWNDIKKDEMEQFYAIVEFLYKYVNKEEDFIGLLESNSN